MSTRRNDPDHDTTPLGFGDEPPPKRQAPPIRVDKYSGHPDAEELDGLPDDDPPARPVVVPEDNDDEPTPRKKKRKKKLDLLQRLERQPETPWATAPLIMLGAGLALCLIPLIVLVVKAGAAAGAVGGVLLFVAVLFQVAFMAGVMFGVGILFGIDYGPVGRAFLKLAAVIALVDGVTGGLGLAFYSGCGGFGVLMAICLSVALTFALIQTQFELSGFETTVTVMGIQLASTALAAVAGYVFLSKLAAKAG